MPTTSPGPRDAARSLDLVQRLIVSAIICVVFGVPSCALAAYVSANRARFDAVSATGLWIMSGVIGLLTAGGVLFVNRRKPWHPAVSIGLLPMAVAAYFLFVR